MKRILFVIFVAFLAVSLSNALTVDREMVSAIDANKELTIKFIINPETTQNFEFTDALPTEWQFVSWDVQGIPKETVSFSHSPTSSMDQQKEIYRWQFSNANSSIILTYSVIPKTTGDKILTAVWTHDNQVESKDSEIFVREAGIICGNGICESGYGENNVNCSLDCKTKVANPFFWLALLILATVLSISGLFFREYEKVKPQAPKTQPKGPTKVIKFEVREKKEETPRFQIPAIAPKRTETVIHVATKSVKARIARKKPRKATKKRAVKQPKKQKVKKTRWARHKRFIKKPFPD